jgi:hypothetical protein
MDDDRSDLFTRSEWDERLITLETDDDRGERRGMVVFARWMVA